MVMFGVRREGIRTSQLLGGGFTSTELAYNYRPSFDMRKWSKLSLSACNDRNVTRYGGLFSSNVSVSVIYVLYPLTSLVSPHVIGYDVCGSHVTYCRQCLH